MLDFCIGNNLRILNGRMLGDSGGKFTCFNVHDQSVVDYVLISKKMLKQVLTFTVSSFNKILSDTHCKISFRLLASYVQSVCSSNIDYLKSMPLQYKWNNNSAEKFSSHFTNLDVSHKLLEFNRSCYDYDVDTCCIDFENIMLSAADKTKKSFLKESLSEMV